MKWFIFLFSLLLTFPLKAVEFNGEALASFSVTKDEEVQPSIEAALLINMIETEKLNGHAEIQIKDDSIKINQAYGKFMTSKVDLVIGRQLTGWGSGYNFNPTDVFNQKPLGAAFDPSYGKDGRDAILASFYPADNIALELIYAFGIEQKSDEPPLIYTSKVEPEWGFHSKVNIASIDMEFLYIQKAKRSWVYFMNPAYPIQIEEKRDHLFGASFKTSIPKVDVGVWGEGAYYKELEKYEYVIGIERYFGDTMMNLEYYRNGFGQSKKLKYDPMNMMMGRMVARDYLVPALTHTFNEKFNFTTFLFYNINDQSNAAGLVGQYYYHDQAEFILMPFYIGGKDDTDFGQQAKEAGEYGGQLMVKLTF